MAIYWPFLVRVVPSTFYTTVPFDKQTGLALPFPALGQTATGDTLHGFSCPKEVAVCY